MTINLSLTGAAGDAGRAALVAFTLPSGRQVTRGEFEAIVGAAARRLRAAGIGAGDVVVVAFDHSFRTLVVQLALARIGAAAAPVDFPGELAAARLAESPQPDGSHRRVLYVERAWFQPPSGADDASPVEPHGDPDATAVVLASSWTGGAPKSMALSHARLAARLAIAERDVPISPEARVLTTMGAFTGYGFITLLRALRAGATVVVDPGTGKTADTLATERVSYLVSAPGKINSIVRAQPDGGGAHPSLRTIEFGGARLGDTAIAAIRARLCDELRIVYGSTEIGFVAGGTLPHGRIPDGWVGRVFDGVEAQAVDDALVPLSAGRTGRLRIRGAGLVDGYVGDDEATGQAFRDGWFLTGDLASVSAGGDLSLVGRTDHVINIDGNKGDPALTEDALLAVPWVRDAAVFEVPGREGDPAIWAAVVASGPIDVAQLQAAVRERRGAGIPRFVLPVPEIPRNAGGKVLRERLVALATEAQARSRSTEGR